ncbi:MAG: response regulator [Actinobacteria bacterium]|nr:response regulator [Actinomycetota bacterium]
MSEQGKRTIMIVDDNDDVRRLVRKVLERSGFDVAEAVDGENALGQLDEGLVPDLVLMDIRLPGKFDGLETTCRLKDNSRMQRVPVVALSASVLDRDRQQALASGCSGFIAKPIDIATLPAQIERFISRGTMTPR